MIDWTLLGMTLAILLVGIWYACSSGGGAEDDAAERPSKSPGDPHGNPLADRAVEPTTGARNGAGSRSDRT